MSVQLELPTVMAVTTIASTPEVDLNVKLSPVLRDSSKRRLEEGGASK